MRINRLNAAPSEDAEAQLWVDFRLKRRFRHDPTLLAAFVQ